MEGSSIPERVMERLVIELDRVDLATGGKGLTTIELVQSVSDIFARAAHLLLSFVDELGANGKSIKALLMSTDTRVTHENFAERKKMVMQASLAVDKEMHEMKKNLMKELPQDIRTGMERWMHLDEKKLAERQAALNQV